MAKTKELSPEEIKIIERIGIINQDEGVIYLNVPEDSIEFQRVKHHMYMIKAKGWGLQYGIPESRFIDIYHVHVHYNIHNITTVKGISRIAKPFITGWFDTVCSETFEQMRETTDMLNRIHNRKGLSRKTKHVEITRMDRIRVVGNKAKDLEC